jgi:hypothetical protein
MRASKSLGRTRLPVTLLPSLLAGVVAGQPTYHYTDNGGVSASCRTHKDSPGEFRAEGCLGVSATEEPTAAGMPSDRSTTAILARPSGCIPAGSRVAQVAQLAANGHCRPATLSHTGPRNT